jgi:hypothetical protein
MTQRPTDLAIAGDRGFESGFLQQRVRSEPGRWRSRHAAIAGAGRRTATLNGARRRRPRPPDARTDHADRRLLLFDEKADQELRSNHVPGTVAELGAVNTYSADS